MHHDGSMLQAMNCAPENVSLTNRFIRNHALKRCGGQAKLVFVDLLWRPLNRPCLPTDTMPPVRTQQQRLVFIRIVHFAF
jgi:hypothetical protein